MQSLRYGDVGGRVAAEQQFECAQGLVAREHGLAQHVAIAANIGRRLGHGLFVTDADAQAILRNPVQHQRRAKCLFEQFALKAGLDCQEPALGHRCRE